MTRLLNIKKSFSFLLIAFVVLFHGVLRISELPYATPALGEYFFVCSINLATGKGFNADTTFYAKSPELSNFLNSFFKPEGGETQRKKLSPFNTLHTFTDYQAAPSFVNFPDSLGYRYVLGLIWKYFGLNWYFVGLFHYVLSLMALLALLYCSYRTLGITYSVAIGLIFSASPSEIQYIILLGRDGFPLWFAAYLICALVIFFSKQLTLSRVISYSTLIGLLIYGAMQGRTSTIYFLPLVTIIYFILFFFQTEVVQFKYGHVLKNAVAKKAVLFFLATGLTFSFAIIPQELTEYLLRVDTMPGGFGHVIFLGLGMWGGVYGYHPSQVRYDDSFAYYFVKDYWHRVLGHTDPAPGFLTKEYGHMALKNYLLIIKTYPYFFLRTVVWESFSRTLQYLGLENQVFNLPLRGVHQLVREYTTFIFKENYLFLLSVVGGLLLYFRLKLKRWR